LSRGLKIDLLFNYASLGVLAAAGLLMNLVVVRLMGEAALGVFNQAYAIYIASSQLAVGGVHISVLRSVAQAQGGPREVARVIASGLVLSGSLGVLWCVIIALSRGVWGALLDSPGVVGSLSFVAPALILFSINKTLLAALNGLQSMRVFAVLQALRFCVLIGALTIVACWQRPVAELSAAFLVAELVVMAVAVPCVLAKVGFRHVHIERTWLMHHLQFGAKGMLSGVFIELNTRIDVLAIGFFLSDKEVGRYSLAAVFAEGLYQCLVVVRNQVNPVLCRLLLLPDRQPVLRMVHAAWRYLYPGMAITYLLGLATFHFILSYQVQISEPAQTLSCAAILGAGVLAVSGFVPFDGILLHSGRPAYYTLFTFAITATNAVFNLLLIPLLGIQGAALATGLALALSVFYLSGIMRWQLGFSYLNTSPLRG
jgi:O-antigen/teichoic acid export membrane protein